MKMNKIVQKFQKVENVFFLTMKSGEEMCTFFAKKFFLDARGTGVFPFCGRACIFGGDLVQ